MLSRIPLNVAEYFYSVPLFILLTTCSIFATFADSILYFAGDHYDTNIADIIIWITIPFIMLLFVIEYLMICRLFSCKILNATSCDFVYVFSILSLIIELTRITPKMKQFNYYSLDEADSEYHIDNALYWSHKLFDSFIDFVIYLRVVQAILRAVLYYIYGKEYRDTHRAKSVRKSLQTKYEKSGYQATGIDDGDHSISRSISTTSGSPEPMVAIQPTIMDDADNTAPLPIASGTTQVVLATRNSIELLSDHDGGDRDDGDIYDIDITPKQDSLAKRFKLKLNLTPHDAANNNAIDSANSSPIKNVNNMLSPPQIEIDPSDVDTQSIERIELQHTPFQAMDYKQIADIDDDGDDDERSNVDNIIMESHTQGENWGIFPVFASKLGIIGDVCVVLISLLDHPYLFMVRICIFTAYFCILMYVSAHHFVQFIRSFLDSNKYVSAAEGIRNDDKYIDNDEAQAADTAAAANKDIRSIVLNPAINNKVAMNGATTVIFNPWTCATATATAAGGDEMDGKEMEFRTGQDEIKKIVRVMLTQTNTFGDESSRTRCKLENILSLLQDIDAMEKGNIEEKIELDEELGMEEKQWLNQTLLSKHDNMSGATPHFEFKDQVLSTPHDNITAVTVTPLTSQRDHVISPQETLTQSHHQIEDDDNDIEIDIAAIIEKHLSEKGGETCIDVETLRRTLSSDMDRITAQIMNLDGSLDTMELNRLTGTPLLHCSVCIFVKYDFGNELKVNFKRFYHFISFIECAYHGENPYHNGMHATEVMLATMIFVDCLDPTVRAMMTTQQIFCAFIASIIHDVDHPGNNNAFEINSQSDLSVLYSDESVLEFHHLQVAFAALKREANHFTHGWDKQSWKEFRKQCIYSVLATDLSKHFGTIAHVKQLKIMKKSDLEYVFKSIIKMSDLSHVTKPLRQHIAWTKRITQEFHNQGDKEVRIGLEVSPLCNKQNTKIAKGQVGFIKFIVSPLYGVAQRFFKKNSTFDECIMTQLNSNWKYWENEAKKEETPKVKVKKERKNVIKKRSISRRKRLQQKNVRPQSATCYHHSNRRIAILTNLENTPPPILPSSVRMIARGAASSKLAMNDYFFSPNSRSDIAKGGKEVIATFKFDSYHKIGGKKRNRSSSNPANCKLELANPNVTSSHNKLTELVTPRSILRLGSKGSTGLISPPATATATATAAATANTMNQRSLTPQHAITRLHTLKRDLLRTKSSASDHSHNTATTPHAHMISPKQFISPYSISHDVQPQQQITIHEEKSSSDTGDNPQHFKFEGVIEQNS